jgi:hypothetical protein
MTKRTFVGVMAVGLAAALTGSALVASNMGFKLNRTLGTTGTGNNTLSLPDNRQSGLNNAEDLMRDITFNNVATVSKFLAATDTYQNYTGRKNAPTPNTAFPLASGEGYFVKMNTATAYIAVGSDNPSLAYNLSSSVGTGNNFFAYNYHQTAADAEALMRDIGFNNVATVSKFLAASDTYQNYTGRKNAPTPNTSFALAPGEAYFVKMNTTVSYTPSHY